MTDDRVQHYRLLHRLGAGGMGEVYLAEDPRLGRPLALKLLPAEFAQDANRRARFLTEARAAAALNHPNICTVYDAGETAEGRLFIALELLEGESLEVRLKGGPLEVMEVVRIGVQLASAMEAAHAKGILHRDLKPANLHLDARGHLKVLDFGLAKRLVPEPGAAEDSTQWQTRTGGILGTPQYMSPEQALGKALDPRSDLFSCGAVLYELLTGRGPFGGPTFAELMEQIVHRPPEAIARFNYAVPAELERVVLKCLQKDADQRYQSARELAVDLRGVEAQIRGAAVIDQPGQPQVVTWVLLGTNAEELERTVGVSETARILKDFQEAMGRGLRKFSQARQEASLGSTVLLSFARPSNAVQWALETVGWASTPVQCRAGLHLGEVAAAEPEADERYGGQLTVCERLLQLARPGQVLMGRAVFDSARQVLPAGSVEGAAELSWVSHGPYLFEGIEGPMEVCEVDSHFFLRACEPRVYELWDARSFTVKKRIKVGPSNRIALSSEGSTVAVGSAQGVIQLLEVGATHESSLTGGVHSCVHALAFSRDGRTLISGHSTGRDGDGDLEFLIWDLEQSTERCRFHANHEFHFPAALGSSPDSQWVVIGGRDGMVRIWDLWRGSEARSFRAGNGCIMGLSFSPDGYLLATTSASDPGVKLWDLRTGELVQWFAAGQDQSFHSIAFAPHEPRLLAGSGRGVIIVWDQATGDEVLSLQGRSGMNRLLEFATPDVLISSDLVDLRIWRGEAPGSDE